ncbi:hypothetical protein [Maridesulfovibrio bastinii]|nr:hypothetical protein [Maridesulfovibrio bastinii]
MYQGIEHDSNLESQFLRRKDETPNLAVRGFVKKIICHKQKALIEA